MSDRRTRQVGPESLTLTQLKGAPRGMLLFYILHTLAVKPKHGYEILQDIDSKTGGAWRPGVGSVYPILKRLQTRGFIQADEKGSVENRRVYSITEKGTEFMKEREDLFSSYSQRWMAMRHLFFDMLDPAGLSSMFVEGSKKQFEMTKELLEAKRDSMSSTDVDFMLREYSLNLERQLNWTQSQLRELRTKSVSPKLR